MKYVEMGRPIENYGKKEQKEWLDNTLPDSHPCEAGNKEEEHIRSIISTVFFTEKFHTKVPGHQFVLLSSNDPQPIRFEYRI